MPNPHLKHPGSARFVFISRIVPIKNLPFAIRLLGTITGKATFDIFGPIESDAYWETCQKEIEALPSHASATYRGPLATADVRVTFAEYDFFLFPTRGENFGHVILEALSASVPVLLSDKVTPWNDVQARNAGFLLPLDDQDAWKLAMQACVDCDLETYRAMASNAYRYALDSASLFDEAKEKTAEMFRNAIKRQR